MKNFRELFGGLFMAVLTGLIVLGALTLSLVEGASSPVEPPRATETPFELPTYQVVQTTASVPTGTPTVTATIACVRPIGWIEHIVQFGDSLAGLAEQTGLTTARLREANCLLSDELLTGAVLFLPEIQPTATSLFATSSTQVKCGPPLGWVSYRVQSKDTLYRLSQDFGVSVAQLQFANCMGSSTFLRTGDMIYVPNTATRTPDISATPTGTKEPTSTSTPEIVSPTETPTETPVETPTPDFTAIPTEIPTP